MLPSEHLQYHIASGDSLLNNVFRYGSEAWGALIREAREYYKAGHLTELYDDDLQTLEENVAILADFNGRQVMLEVPEYDWVQEVWIVFVLNECNEVREVHLPRYKIIEPEPENV